MESEDKAITYFKYCGEVNTPALLRKANVRCQELGIHTVVVASETGRCGLLALEIFRDIGTRLVIVTHIPAKTWGPKGDIPIGLQREEYTATRETLETNNAVIVQGTRPLVPPSRVIKWDAPTPEGILDQTLELFGAGTKIAIEASIMATDSGHVPEGEEIISCAGTFKGLDTALIVRATYSINFFKDFEIHEFIARPRYRVRELPEFKSENWKGDLDQYYEVGSDGCV